MTCVVSLVSSRVLCDIPIHTKKIPAFYHQCPSLDHHFYTSNNCHATRAIKHFTEHPTKSGMKLNDVYIISFYSSLTINIKAHHSLCCKMIRAILKINFFNDKINVHSLMSEHTMSK